MTVTNYRYPTFLLAEVVRSGELPLETAVNRMTEAPARWLGLSGRGRLEPGAAADVCVIDPERLALGPAEIRYDLRLDPRGDLFGPLKASLTGSEAGELRATLLSIEPEGYAEAVTKFFGARGVPFEVESVSIADLTALRRPLGIRASINARGFLEKDGAELSIPLARIVGAKLPPPPEVRRAPLRLGAPSHVELRATVTLPFSLITMYSSTAMTSCLNQTSGRVRRS